MTGREAAEHAELVALRVGEHRPRLLTRLPHVGTGGAQGEDALDLLRHVLVDDPVLRAEVQQAVDAANRTVSQAESIRRFTVLSSDWSEEGGQLTPSLKLRRAVVTQQCRTEIEALYAG